MMPARYSHFNLFFTLMQLVRVYGGLTHTPMTPGESDNEADENTGKSNVNTKREEEKGASSHERRRR